MGWVVTRMRKLGLTNYAHIEHLYGLDWTKNGWMKQIPQQVIYLFIY
jgi:hypothetical protein